MKRLIISSIFFLSIVSLYANNITDIKASSIPPELLVNANAVIQDYSNSVTIYPSGNGEEKISITTTVLNENGENYSYLAEFYDKYSSISDIKGTVYDKDGKKIRRLEFDEIYDISAITGFSIYDDNRLKYANPKVGSFPYTVVYSFTKKFKSFLVIPGFRVYPGYYVSVQKASYSINLVNGVKINYKGNKRFTYSPSITENKGTKTITWVVENQHSLVQEPLSESIQDIIPSLTIAPENYKFDDYEGSNKSWNELGNWAYKLLKGRDNLPDATVQKIKDLVADKKNDFEKASALYEYMQKKVRYVSIQVGIGGFQPFHAEIVDRYSYGDCKALTNYMMTLLNAVGIKSYYCLVSAGSDSPNIDKEFVCTQFNHAFLMLPIEKDTLFLECTSQQVPFGYNGTFTDDRDVLVVDSTNSFIKHTNVYRKEKNNTVNSFIFKIEPQLDCNIIQKSVYTGVASEPIRYLMEASPEKQRANVLNRFQLKMVKISTLTYHEKRDIVPIITENIEYYVPKIAQVTTNSVIVPFNQVTQMSELKRVSDRKSNIVISRNEFQTDSLIFIVPKEIKADKIPVANSFSSIFGKYKLEVKIEENKIIFIRFVEWNKGTFSPEKYSELLSFQRKINDMDRQVIIFKK